jgi:hypothetical protein
LPLMLGKLQRAFNFSKITFQLIQDPGYTICRFARKIVCLLNVETFRRWRSIM